MTDCGHNYCEDCLVKHVDGRTTWMCPLSRKGHHRTVSSLPRNYLIEQLVQSMTTPPPQPASNPASHSETNQFESCTTHIRPNELRKKFLIIKGGTAFTHMVPFFKTNSDCLVHSTDQCYECCHKKMCGGIEKIGCDVITKSEMEQLIKKESKLIKSNAKDRDIFMCAPRQAPLGMALVHKLDSQPSKI